MITRGVLSRSMFNRNARNKLYNMGGLASVKKLSNGGPPLGASIPDTFELMYQKALKEGDRTGLQALIANKRVSNAMKQRAAQASQNLMNQQIQSQSSQPSDSSGSNLTGGISSVLRWAFPKMFKDENQNTATAQEDTTAAEVLNNLTATDNTTTTDDTDDNTTANNNDIVDLTSSANAATNNNTSSDEPIIGRMEEFAVPSVVNSTSASANILDDREKFTEDFESEAGDTDIPFKGSTSVEEEEPLALGTTKKDTTTFTFSDKKVTAPKVETNIDAVVSDPIDTGTNLTNEINQISQSDQDAIAAGEEQSAETVNDQIIEKFGLKDKKEKLTMKERVARNMELYKELFGEDPEAEKKINGFNLAYFGFAMAAGDSPNALQNMGKAGMKFAEKSAKTIEARKAREDKLKLFGLQNAMDSEAAEVAWERSMEKFREGNEFAWTSMKFKDASTRDMFVAGLNAKRHNLVTQLKNSNDQLTERLGFQGKLQKQNFDFQTIMKNQDSELAIKLKTMGIKSQEELAQFQATLQKDIAGLNNEAALTRVAFGNYDSAAQIILDTRMSQTNPATGVNYTVEEAQGTINGKTFDQDIIDFAKLMPSKSAGTNQFQKIRPQSRYVGEGLEKYRTDNLAKSQMDKIIESDFNAFQETDTTNSLYGGKLFKELTPAQQYKEVEKFLKKEWQSLYNT